MALQNCPGWRKSLRTAGDSLILASDQGGEARAKTGVKVWEEKGSQKGRSCYSQFLGPRVAVAEMTK